MSQFKEIRTNVENIILGDGVVMRAMLIEYRMADPSAHYYLGTRACRAWKEN